MKTHRAKITQLREDPILGELAEVGADNLDQEHKAEQRPHLDGQCAQDFAELHGARMRFCWEWKTWLVYDGTRWVEDPGAGPAEALREMALDYYHQAGDAPDSDRRKRLAKLAEHADQAKRRRDILESARSEPGIRIMPDAFDRDPWLFNVQNGTIDLRTGTLQKHDPKDHLRKVSPAAFDPAAEAPVWRGFLSSIMNDDAELVAYLQRWAGYTLTGVIRDHVLPVFFGAGRNGRSTFINAMADILGPYMVALPEGMLMHRKSQPHPTELMMLAGARLATSNEINSDAQLAEQRVKSLTGGDTFAARGMYQDFRQIEPTHKLVLITNHRPEVRDTSPAMWERIHLVPFERTFDHNERDPELGSKLKAESAGILRWAVEGCLEWQRRGQRIDPPQAIRSATEDYRTEADVVGRFIAERCEVAKGLSVATSKLYSAFTQWAESGKEPTLPLRRFGEELSSRGFKAVKGAKGMRSREGIKVRPNDDEDMDF